MRPMLATPGRHVPTGPEWSHEVKWDGVRLIGVVSGRGVRLTTRNDNDATIAWPDLVDVAPQPRHGDLVVDGEVIVLNERGLPDFRTLAERMHVRSPTTAARLVRRLPATYMVFDVLRIDGRDLVGLPLDQRRALLAELAEGGSLGGWQVPPAYDDGEMLLHATREQGLEGIVSKRRTSLYRPGERSKEWLKFAHRFSGSYVVGGWRPQEGTSDRLASLLVGQITPAGLLYRGRVGSGIGAAQSRLLRELVVETTASPFADEVPRVDAVGTHWTEPTLVVELESHGVGYDRLRQPSFRGVRTDLRPEDLA